MTSRTEAIFVDTSMFKALLDKKDDFHEKAKQIWENYEKEHVLLLTSNFILDETFTLLRIRCGLKIIIAFRELLIANASVIKLIRVLVSDEKNAWQWFEKDWSKLSFTDCVSFAIMQRLKITRVATFDSDFKKAGFIIEQ